MRTLLLVLASALALASSAEAQLFRWNRGGTYQLNSNGRYCNNPNCAMCNRLFGPMDCSTGKCGSREAVASPAPLVVTPVLRTTTQTMSYATPVYARPTPPAPPVYARPAPPAPPAPPALPQASASPPLTVEDVVEEFDPIPEDAARLLVALARVEVTDTVVDLGCGDGRILEQAADAGASVVGVEINETTLAKARRRLGQRARVRLVLGDMFDADLTGADVVTLYHYPPLLQRLVPILGRQLRPGARVVSYAHDIPGVCTKRYQLGPHEFFVWEITRETTPLWAQHSIQ